MTKRPTKNSTAKAVKRDIDGKEIVYYLDEQDEDRGLDIELVLQGFEVLAINNEELKKTINF